MSTPKSKAPKPRAQTIGRLDSATGLRRELARLYRAGRLGQEDPGTVSRLASVLSILARLIETSDLEQRIERLEANADEGPREPWRAGR